VQKMKSKQAAILVTIKNYFEKNQFSPSIREIAESINVKSTSTVFYHLKELESLGYLEREHALPRAMRLSNKGLNIIKVYEMIKDESCV